MRLIGLDWGTSRIGISVSDPLGTTALPLPFIKNDMGLIPNLKALISEYGIGEIIVGLPKRMNGTLGPSAESVKAFCGSLEKELDIKISLWDERLTTKLAEKSFREAGISAKESRKLIDSSSASVMLQSYLDSGKR